MGTDSTSDDSFGDIMPQAAIEIPTAVGNYLTHGDDGHGVETRVVEGFRNTARDRGNRG
ncbi:hypothetical protein JM654_15240 [Microbacterium oxydans]|nr:hypothetical protein [Microbacterium oxydans]